MITRAKRKLTTLYMDLTCGVCREVLPRSYVHLTCGHNVCGECLESMLDLSHDRTQVQCPVCRKVTGDLTGRSEELDNVLETHPREMMCGLVCRGWERSENHDRICFDCMTLKNAELLKNMQMLEMENRRLHSELMHRMARNEVLETQMRLYTSFFQSGGTDMDEEDD